MPELVETCLNYIKDHLQDIINVPCNIPTYKSHLAKKLARIISIDQLDSIEKTNDVLISRLYKKKLELFFEDPQNLLNKCEVCSCLFTQR